MAGEDEVRIDASMRDDISAALSKIEQRIEAVERAVGSLGRKGAKSGEEFAAGMEGAAKAADDVGDKSKRAKREVDDLGDKAGKAGAKAAAGSVGLEAFAKKAKKAGKEAGGFGNILMAFKIAGIVSGVFALAGGVSALGAGAAIAIGSLAPLVGVLGGVLPLVLAAKLGMYAFQQGLTASVGPLKDWKKTFDESVGRAVANGGMAKGMDYLTKSLDGFTKVATKGFGGFGAEFGITSHYVGDLVKSTPFLNQVSIIFAGLQRILHFLLSGLVALGQAFLNIVQAALPAAIGMAGAFEWVATSLRNWTAEQLANGKMTEFITRAWEMFLKIAGIVVDVVIGLYNVFKIAAGFAGNMGQSIHDAAWEFRLWTASAEGQQRITKYFQDSLPALQEMGKLLRFVVGGLAGLGANQNVAPLLAQINSQLLPALANLVQNLSGQGGLGPAVIQAATALAQLFAGLDFSGLTTFAQAIAGVLQALVWLQQNVPGANFVISALLFSMLGFKALGPVFTMIGKGAEAFAWMNTALTATEGLTLGQKLFTGTIKQVLLAMVSVGGAVVQYVLPALKMIATVGIGALRALSTALFTTPIGWIILAIIAVIAAIYLLWTKCAWFRDAVMAVWNAIKTAAIAVWDAIKTAAIAVVTALVAAWNFVRDAAIAVWNALKTAWQATVDFFVTVGMWIWDHGLKQVVAFIVTGFQIAFSIVKFIVQTVIFFIALQIKIVATVAEYTWKGIVAIFQWATNLLVAGWKWFTGLLADGWNWLWSNVIKPVIDFFVNGWNYGMALIQAAWARLQMAIQIVMNFIWFSIIKPVIDFFVNGWNFGMAIIQDTWNKLWAQVQIAINVAWSYIKPIFDLFSSAGSSAWQAISDAAGVVWGVIKSGWDAVSGFLGGIWDGLKSKGTAVWDAIKGAASSVGDAVKGVWDSVKGAVAGVWNFLARGWNSIPSVTIPDWVPLIGGKTFSLPKLPMMWSGGEIDGGGRAIVGEHGPEPLIRNGRFAGMVGANGPEVASIPRGGYVVPNLRTLSALPGLAKTIPSGVAAAVARSVPGYAGALSGGSAPSGGSGATAALAAQVGRLAHAVATQQVPMSVTGGEDVRAAVLDAQREIEREKNLRRKYQYGGG